MLTFFEFGGEFLFATPERFLLSFSRDRWP